MTGLLVTGHLSTDFDFSSDDIFEQGIIIEVYSRVHDFANRKVTIYVYSRASKLVKTIQSLLKRSAKKIQHGTRHREGGQDVVKNSKTQKPDLKNSRTQTKKLKNSNSNSGTQELGLKNSKSRTQNQELKNINSRTQTQELKLKWYVHLSSIITYTL